MGGILITVRKYVNRVGHAVRAIKCRCAPAFKVVVFNDDWEKFKMTKIEQLDNEIKKKTQELNESLKTQILLRERLKNNNRSMGEVLDQLKAIEAYLEDSNQYIYKLQQENHKLKLSCDGWMRRAINLEFKVLNARDATKE